MAWAMRVAGLGKGGQFAGDAAGVGRADPLEDLQGLPQYFVCPGGGASGQGASAQAGQCVRLIKGAPVARAGGSGPATSTPRLAQGHR